MVLKRYGINHLFCWTKALLSVEMGASAERGKRRAKASANEREVF